MNTLDDRTLEALVDGELNESDRAILLRRLDDSADGWRRLALAFLADQTLRQSLVRPGLQARPRLLAVSQPVARFEAPAAAARAKSSRSRVPAMRHWAATIAACAACALAAFLIGTWSTGTPSDGSIATTHPLPPESSPLAKNEEQSEARPDEEPGPASVQRVSAAMPTLTPNVRKELERRGFVIQERPRLLPVLRPDGRTIQVLVNEIELRYVGRQSIL